jgi:hypothetical protein
MVNRKAQTRKQSHFSVRGVLLLEGTSKLVVSGYVTEIREGFVSLGGIYFGSSESAGLLGGPACGWAKQ